MIVSLFVHPSSRKSLLDMKAGNAYLKSSAKNNAANMELLGLLKKKYPDCSIRIQRGMKSRKKTVLIKRLNSK